MQPGLASRGRRDVRRTAPAWATARQPHVTAAHSLAPFRRSTMPTPASIPAGAVDFNPWPRSPDAAVPGLHLLKGVPPDRRRPVAAACGSKESTRPDPVSTEEARKSADRPRRRRLGRPERPRPVLPALPPQRLHIDVPRHLEAPAWPLPSRPHARSWSSV